MTLKRCPREKEVRELIARGEWPLAAENDNELRTHVAACGSCGDLVPVAEAFHKARAASIASARLAAPGALWWRAQLRRRQAAVEQITRPLMGAQIFGLAFTLMAGAGFVVFESLTSDSWRIWLQDLPQNTALHWDNLMAAASADPAWTWMMIGPALLLLGGVAIYLSFEKQ
jgi:hypothetical protein